MSEIPEKKPRTRKTTKKEDDEFRKKILEEESNRLQKTAEKIALKAMTELQLTTQAKLSEEQLRAISILASGTNKEDAARILGKKPQEITSWFSQPTFVRELNDATLKTGFADKNERIRKSKKIAETITDKMMEKIADGELDNMNVSTLSKLAMDWSLRIDKLVDEKEDNSNKDLTVLILGHMQSTAGKSYSKIEDFLEDPEFQYETLETTAKEVIDE